MSNYVFSFYHPVDRGEPVRTLVGIAGEDIKEALVQAARKEIVKFGHPGGVLGFFVTDAEVESLSEAEIKSLADKSVLQDLGFNLTPIMLEQISAPADNPPASEPAAAPAPQASPTKVPARAPRASKPKGNAANPTPATADSVIEDDPEKEEGKAQYAALIKSAVEANAAAGEQAIRDAITNSIINNCPGVEGLQVSITGTKVVVTSSIGAAEVICPLIEEVAPKQPPAQ